MNNMAKPTCKILPKMDPNYIYLFYCKCRKGTGAPLIIKVDGKELYAHKIKFRNVGDMELAFNNSPREIARRGATTVLSFDRKQYGFKCIRTGKIYQITGKFKQNFVVEK